MPIVYQNGKYLPDHEVRISCLDRSFLFGEGLFETFRSYDGKIPFLKDHINRLEWSATFLNIDLPPVDFAGICQDLLQKNCLKDARFKIVLSRSHRGFSDLTRLQLKDEEGFLASLIVYCGETGPANPATNYKLKLIKTYQNDTLPIAAMKTTNYLVKSLARAHANESGFDDGVLMNSRGLVTETCSANIFWIDRDARLWTVMSDQGALPGIMQKKIVDALKENKITLKQGVITPEELSSSREVFITNSIIGIQPVTQIDDRQISGGEKGSITAMIMDVWKKYFDKLLGGVGESL